MGMENVQWAWNLLPTELQDKKVGGPLTQGTKRYYRPRNEGMNNKPSVLLQRAHGMKEQEVNHCVAFAAQGERNDMKRHLRFTLKVVL